MSRDDPIKGELILTRRKNDSIIIGDVVEIKIKDIYEGYKGKEVRISIIAPRTLKVNRKEVYLRNPIEHKKLSTVVDDAQKN